MAGCPVRELPGCLIITLDVALIFNNTCAEANVCHIWPGMVGLPVHGPISSGQLGVGRWRQADDRGEVEVALGEGRWRKMGNFLGLRHFS